MATVLIVEDDVFIRELAELTIQDYGYQTLAAGGIEEAIGLIRSPQAIDVLFTDIYLQNEAVGGCDLAQQAIKLRTNLRVLYTTGNAISGKMISQFVEGAECLRKPYTPTQLKRSLEAMVAA